MKVVTQSISFDPDVLAYAKSLAKANRRPLSSMVGEIIIAHRESARVERPQEMVMPKRIVGRKIVR
jgi:hypothetical protein